VTSAHWPQLVRDAVVDAVLALDESSSLAGLTAALTKAAAR
jgi:hypothetical protein